MYHAVIQRSTSASLQYILLPRIQKQELTSHNFVFVVIGVTIKFVDVSYKIVIKNSMYSFSFTTIVIYTWCPRITSEYFWDAFLRSKQSET